ncbi:MAG: biosynthetic-type acetolactate synthase large subunit [Opitutaceae bacterium]|jgi:acetolactate synthase-1/2/3 large subunit
MKHTGAIILRTLLERQGIRILSGIPGGAILPFYDALHESAIQHVLARHEQGAGFIAQGMARATGKAAVCLATSGPGATNLLTAIADARLDSIPLVAITGQVPQALIGTDAFQEVDMYGLTVPITKHNFLVRSVEELMETIPLAFQIAESGRPGPVSVDIPKDVLVATMEVTNWPAPRVPGPVTQESDSKIEALAELIANARRPMLYLGGGVIAAEASNLCRTLAHRIQAPTACTLMALGSMPPEDPLYMGMLGMHAARGTNYLLEETDLLLAIGARFDDRATGKVAEFCPNATIVHIDIDAAEIGKIKIPFLGLTGDAADIVSRLLKRLKQASRPEWTGRAAQLRSSHSLRMPGAAEDPLHPLGFCRTLGELLPADAIVTTDVGQHQMWMAQAFPVRSPRSFLTSGGLGTMGFGLPAAIGAALALPGRRVACLTGDGSFLMNIQELATLAELNLPVAVLVMNNAHLGLVRQQQELFYKQRYSASRFASNPDFAAIARGFGIRGIRLHPDRDPLGELAGELAKPGPCVIDIPIHEQAMVFPMVPPGAPNRTMIDDLASTTLA